MSAPAPNNVARIQAAGTSADPMPTAVPSVAKNSVTSLVSAPVRGRPAGTMTTLLRVIMAAKPMAAMPPTREKPMAVNLDCCGIY